MLMPGVDTFFSTQAFSFSEKCNPERALEAFENALKRFKGVFLMSAKRPLTTENNNVKFPVAERLILVGDASPETARLPQS